MPVPNTHLTLLLYSYTMKIGIYLLIIIHTIYLIYISLLDLYWIQPHILGSNFISCYIFWNIKCKISAFHLVVVVFKVAVLSHYLPVINLLKIYITIFFFPFVVFPINETLSHKQPSNMALIHSGKIY